MAKIHGVAGEWARIRGMVLGLWPLGLGLFVSGFALAACVVAGRGWGVALLAAGLATIGWSLYSGIRRVESFYVGARGEERVSNILRSLPERYHVFNDYVAGGVHVDHIVVGPAGVYAIETKFWNGAVTVEESRILVDGRLPTRSPLRQVTREAALVKAALAKAGWNGDVTPVLAFASDTFQAHIAEVQGAVVINSCDLPQAFATTRIAIAPSELERLVAIMETDL